MTGSLTSKTVMVKKIIYFGSVSLWNTLIMKLHKLFAKFGYDWWKRLFGVMMHHRWTIWFSQEGGKLTHRPLSAKPGHSDSPAHSWASFCRSGWEWQCAWFCGLYSCLSHWGLHRAAGVIMDNTTTCLPSPTHQTPWMDHPQATASITKPRGQCTSIFAPQSLRLSVQTVPEKDLVSWRVAHIPGQVMWTKRYLFPIFVSAPERSSTWFWFLLSVSWWDVRTRSWNCLLGWICELSWHTSLLASDHICVLWWGSGTRLFVQYWICTLLQVYFIVR